MLSFAEEIFLFALDDREGCIKPLPVSALEYAMAGALLIELAFLNKIDVDLKTLRVVDNQATGSPLLDKILRQIEGKDLSGVSAAAEKTDAQSIPYWLSFLAGKAKQLQEGVLDQLVSKGILKVEDKKILWVFKTRRYPLLNNHEIKEVKTRLRELILSNEIPDPREAVLVSLVDACHLFDDLFSDEEFERVKPRIKALAKLDLIGQEVTKSIREIAQAMALAMMP
jgi:hypothetical protein